MDSPHGFGLKPALIDPESFRSWIIYEDDELLVLNKPGWVVCHPSKAGPWSSLVGAGKAYLGVEKLHLVARLDRETSGVVILAKVPRAARAYQMALEKGRVRKEYLVLLRGRLPQTAVTVEQSLARDMDSPVVSKQTVRQDRTARSAITHFHKLYAHGNRTLAWISLETGRKHQIRAHAEWLQCPVAGDKIYGGDPESFLEFIETGWTKALENRLEIPRQALHAFRTAYAFRGETCIYTAPLPDDFRDFAVAMLPMEPGALATVELLRATAGFRAQYPTGVDGP